ncbi:MAG: STAS domain-containing protein [Anaerolineales bacterium]|nr:STAS domain-containing protein [Anaerolineales bacterium]
MEIDVLQNQGKALVTIVKPHGAIDASSYTLLIERARELYHGGMRLMLLDLSDVPYMSSSGIVALHTAALLLRGETPSASGWETAHAIDRDIDKGFQKNMKLLNPQPNVQRVLEMVGLNRFFQIFTDLNQAIESFR